MYCTELLTGKQNDVSWPAILLAIFASYTSCSTIYNYANYKRDNRQSLLICNGSWNISKMFSISYLIRMSILIGYFSPKFVHDWLPSHFRPIECFLSRNCKVLLATKPSQANLRLAGKKRDLLFLTHCHSTQTMPSYFRR